MGASMRPASRHRCGTSVDVCFGKSKATQEESHKKPEGSMQSHIPLDVSHEHPLPLEGGMGRGMPLWHMQTIGPNGQPLQMPYELAATRDDWHRVRSIYFKRLVLSLFMRGLITRLNGDRYLFSLIPINYLTQWVYCEIPVLENARDMAIQARDTIMDAGPVHVSNKTKQFVRFVNWDASKPETGPESEGEDCPCCMEPVHPREVFQWCERCRTPIHVNCMALCLLRSAQCPTCNLPAVMLNENIGLAVQEARARDEYHRMLVMRGIVSQEEIEEAQRAQQQQQEGGDEEEEIEEARRAMEEVD